MYFPQSNPSPAFRARSRPGGTLSIVVLVIAAAVAVTLLYAQTTSRQRLQSVQREMESSRLQLALTDAILQALPVLAEDPDLQVDHPSEDWAVPIEHTSPEGVAVRVEISDASGRFDLNNLYVETQSLTREPAGNLLREVFTYCGDFSPSDRVVSLTDWIDPDEDGLREAPYYKDQGLEWRPPNRWLQSWDELLSVPGFDETWLQTAPMEDRSQRFSHRLRDLATILPVPRRHPIRININTAPRALLEALVGVQHEALVDTVIGLRDQRPIRDAQTIGLVFPAAVQRRLMDYTDVRSEWFWVHGRAYRDGVGVDATVLVNRDPGGHVEVVRWMP